MKTQLILISLLITPTLIIGQLFSPIVFFNVGDTLTVVSSSGIILRDSASTNSDKVLSIPFGSKVIVLGHSSKLIEFQNRRGIWINTKFKDKAGFVFSGFLTNLKIPKLDLTKNECDNLYWFEEIARFNADSIVYKGIKEFKESDSIDEKTGYRSEWEIYKDETYITRYTGYEFEMGIIESREFNMNDAVNIVEYYLDKLKTKCDLEIDMRGEYKNLKLKYSKDDFFNVVKVECPEIHFSAEKVAHKIIIIYPISDCISLFEIRR